MPPRAPLRPFLLPPTFLLPAASAPIAAAKPSPSLTFLRTIKSIHSPKPNRFNHHPDYAPLTTTKSAALERKLLADALPLRPGALAIKYGMTAMYDPATGLRTACTVLQLDRNEVMAHKTRKEHGYWAVQIGAGWRHPDNITRPMLGHFAKAGVSPKKWVSEFRVRGEEGLLEVGRAITPSWFKEGQFVDTKSNSRGQGFAGGMKRHGFGGQPASHGQSLTHRTMGSAGASQGSGSRVLPGKRMPGRMGNEQVTVQNLKVMKVDEENGFIVVNGCVAGPKGCRVKIQDAYKKPWPEVSLIDAATETEAATPTA